MQAGLIVNRGCHTHRPINNVGISPFVIGSANVLTSIKVYIIRINYLPSCALICIMLIDHGSFFRIDSLNIIDDLRQTSGCIPMDSTPFLNLWRICYYMSIFVEGFYFFFYGFPSAWSIHKQTSGACFWDRMSKYCTSF